MNRRAIIGAIGAVLLAFLTLYFASPLFAFQALKGAVKSGDQDALEKHVDFPAIRGSLKSQMNAQLLANMQQDPDLRDNPFAGLAFMMAPAIVDRAVETIVTPEGLSALVSSGEVRSEDGVRPNSNPANKPKAKMGYKDLDTFTVSFDAEGEGATRTTTLVMKRQGLFDWKLKRVDLPKNLLQA